MGKASQAFSLLPGELYRERREFPRFPYSFVVFRWEDKKKKEKLTFEVCDLSLQGVKLSLRDGAHSFQQQEQIKGHLHWAQDEMMLEGEIRWTTQKGLGLKLTDKCSKKLQQFFTLDKLIKSLREIKDIDSAMDYWLKGHGPLEIFVWTDKKEKLSHLIAVFHESFVEYRIKTNEFYSGEFHRTESVTYFQDVYDAEMIYDGKLDKDKMKNFVTIMNQMDQHLLPQPLLKEILNKISL